MVQSSFVTQGFPRVLKNTDSRTPQNSKRQNGNPDLKVSESSEYRLFKFSQYKFFYFRVRQNASYGSARSDCDNNVQSFLYT